MSQLSSLRRKRREEDIEADAEDTSKPLLGMQKVETVIDASMPLNTVDTLCMACSDEACEILNPAPSVRALTHCRPPVLCADATSSR